MTETFHRVLLAGYLSSFSEIESKLVSGPRHWWWCFSGSCITQMELCSARSHIIKYTIAITSKSKLMTYLFSLSFPDT